MKIKEINIDGRIIEYQLNIKNIKRCYLRIISGKVIVNTSPDFSVETIEKLIYDHKETILNQLDSYIPKYDYKDGGYVNVFNQRYMIILKDINERRAVIHDDKIYVYHAKIQSTIEAELKNILTDYIYKQIKYQLDNDFKRKMPVIEIKKFKSRWGSCFSKQNKVSFNLALVHLDKWLIDYVIVHELCHFMQANHSKLFYLEVEKRLPDYKKREKRLKEIGI